LQTLEGGGRKIARLEMIVSIYLPRGTNAKPDNKHDTIPVGRQKKGGEGKVEGAEGRRGHREGI